MSLTLQALRSQEEHEQRQQGDLWNQASLTQLCREVVALLSLILRGEEEENRLQSHLSVSMCHESV